MSKFNKADDSKSRVDLIESKFILGIGAVLDGEVIDKKSGKPHTYHIGCNAMFLDYFDRLCKIENQ